MLFVYVVVVFQSCCDLPAGNGKRSAWYAGDGVQEDGDEDGDGVRQGKKREERQNRSKEYIAQPTTEETYSG